MSNMSYCRFSNTLQDLKVCYEHIDDDLGEEEAKARRKLIKLCALIGDECWEDEFTGAQHD